EELMTSHCAGWGNAYAQIILDGAGRVRELWPLRPDRMSVERKGGELRYYYLQQNGQEVPLAAWQVHHRRAMVMDGLTGMSPLRVAMLAVSLGMATEEFGARFFAQGARPGFLLSHPGELTDKAYERLKRVWNSETLENAHKVRIIEEGMKVEQIGIPPEEAQFLETRRFQAQEVARLFRMPPHKIGLLENATFSNIEHQAIEFVTDTIRPWLIRNEQAMYRDLLSENEQEAIYFEYLVDGLLRGDTATRYQSYAVARQWGWLSANDIRRMENMPPIDGGDVYLQPLNMSPAGQFGDQAAAARTVDPTWIAPLVEDRARRLVRREANDLRRKGASIARKDGDFGQWAAQFYDGWMSAAGEEMAATVAAAARATGRSETTLSNAVHGALWERTQRSLAQVRLVVSECGGTDETPDDALERYADTIEEAGAQALAASLMAVLIEAGGTHATGN
ncbi:MAG: phage portal protein, partial [Caldilineaceae bacterium]|nr:phage portal protein [Caldilineaceae bacterium]